MFTVYARNPHFNGVRNTLQFAGGIATSDNVDLIPWFDGHGYKVVQDVGFLDGMEDIFASMTVKELKDFATRHGIDIGKARTKGDIAEKITAGI